MSVYRVPRQVLVYLYRDGEFLLLLRTPELGGFWQGVTGAPEPGESDLDAAIREVREETGYDVANTIRPVGYRYEIRPGPDSLHWSTLYAPGVEAVPEEVFVAAAGSGEPTLQPGEHTEFRWCSVAEALELLHYPDNRTALERAAALLP
jgi:8-oxo-dGTP pyrophosphatase MutT (NUDIX family)